MNEPAFTLIALTRGGQVVHRNLTLPQLMGTAAALQIAGTPAVMTAIEEATGKAFLLTTAGARTPLFAMA